jgi:hypothetical protein
MPTPTIPDGELFMNAITYTGDGVSPKNITNGPAGQSFQPDFVWIKNRSNNYFHNLYDSVRGTGSTKNLISNGTFTEGDSNYAGLYGYLSAFNSNGFQTTNGTDALSSIWVNQSGQNFVAWQWKAGGAAVTNTAGSVSAQVSANTTSGFSIATLTTPASGTFTVGHGLGVAPSLVIIKGRTTAGYTWNVYHRSLGPGGLLVLNTTAAFAANTGVWQNTNPTSSIVYGNSTNWGGNEPYVMYCWAPVAGYSQFGSYTGNGSADGPFVYLGFRPRYIMVKRTDTTSQWSIWDSARNTFNAAGSNLWADSSEAETTSTAYNVDFLSNGFKLRNSSNDRNASGGTYIYAAFAENPFKYANAR